MSVSKGLLKAYRTEYETTPISIEALCMKYNLDEEEIKAQRWSKPLAPATSPTLPTQIQTINESLSLQDDIETFKRQAVTLAKDCLTSFDPAFNSIKDFKDLVDIVDKVEKSYKDNSSDQSLNINVAIQNIVQRFKDDC